MTGFDRGVTNVCGCDSYVRQAHSVATLYIHLFFWHMHKFEDEVGIYHLNKAAQGAKGSTVHDPLPIVTT